MVRVLHITEMLQAAGIESYIMNTYRHINREEIQFDFLVTRNVEEYYDQEIAEMGGRKFVIDFTECSSVFLRVLKESIALEKMLKNSSYNVIHVHSGTPLRIFYLFAAKRAGVRTRIYHSHSAKVTGPHKLLHVKRAVFEMLKQFFPWCATDYFACSELAGQWMFPRRIQDKVRIIHNGIDTEKFRYNPEVEQEYRKKLNLENNFVIGHIGRFNDQKNHTFLLDIFKEVAERNEDARLLLIGEGELEEQIKEKIHRLNLEQKVLLLGVRRDFAQLFQVMNVFVLPSNYEGLPVVGIEAQASGNLCLLSDQVTPETVITPNAKLLSIKSTDIWVREIEKAKSFQKTDTSELIRKHGYDIKDSVRRMEKFYKSRGKVE